MKRCIAALAVCVLVGAALRLVWGDDIEYKADEQYMFERSQRVGIEEDWPALGMVSSTGFRNPGMSVWTFIAAGKLFAADTPVRLARAVQSANILAIALLGVFIVTSVPRGARAAWTWGAVLAAVNPFWVLVHRKIWAQSILPLFSVVLLWSWWRRDTRTGAFLWGLAGAFLAQIHMSGMLFAPALVLGTAGARWMERRGWAAGVRPVRWKSWLLGSTVGIVPMTPWIIYMAGAIRGSGGANVSGLFRPERIAELMYWRRFAATVLGLRLNYTLGAEHFRRFWSYPLYGESATRLVSVSQYIGWAVFVSICLWAAVRVRRFKAHGVPATWSDTDLLLFSSCILYGIFFTALGLAGQWHYLVILFALPFVLLARIVLTRPRTGVVMLSVVTAAQLTLSISLLQYVHRNGGAPGGDYGVSYSHQQSQEPVRLR